MSRRRTLNARLTPLIAEMVDGALTLEQVQSAIEGMYLAEVLKRTHGNVSAAAPLAGLHRNSVIYLLRRHEHIPRNRSRSFVPRFKKPGSETARA